ncbi:uncharacterized protein LOC141729274 [Zonotrichia albicollis]|uniref:uncharacterized protein LOC141729274 n=1 Tax=Zonotrichia albicollis TaxID=44394 RepID=UPI003D80C76C
MLHGCWRIPLAADREGRESFLNRRDVSGPERGAGGVPGRSSASRELHGPGPGRASTTGGASRPSLPCTPSRPVPSRPTQRLPARPSALRYSPDQHRRRGRSGGDPGCWLGGDAPIYTPRGAARCGARRAGAATFSLFGRCRGPERPRSHEWSRASPGRPAHVRQARGSAAPAAAWPNREPSAAPGGQRRRAGAARGREGAAAPVGPRGQQPPVPGQVRRRQPAMLGLGGGCEGSRAGVLSHGFSFFHRKEKAGRVSI